VGKLDNIEHIKHMISAMAYLPKKFGLVIVGDGKRKEELEQMTQQMQEGDIKDEAKQLEQNGLEEFIRNNREKVNGYELKELPDDMATSKIRADKNTQVEIFKKTCFYSFIIARIYELNDQSWGIIEGILKVYGIQ